MTEKRPKRAVLWIIFTTILIDFGGFSVLFPVLPLYAESLGASAAQIGVMMTAYAAGMLLLAPVWGVASDRFGRRPILLLSLAGTSLSFLLLAFVASVEGIVVARALSGMFAATIGTAQAVITDTTSGAERAKGMGVVGAAFGAGMSLGPLLGGVLSRVDPVLPFIAVSLLAASNFALAWWRLPETRPTTLSAPPLRELARAFVPAPVRALSSEPPPALKRYFLLFFLTFGGFSIVEAMVTLLLAERLDATAFEAGLFFGTIGVGLVVTQGGLLRPLVPRTGELPLATAGVALLALAVGALPWVTSFSQALAVGLGIALGYGLMFPCLSAAFTHACQSSRAGERLGESQAMATAGRMVGPVVGGYAMQTADVDAPFAIAFFILASVAVLLWRWRRSLAP